MTDLKIKRIFWGIGNFYRYRLQNLANLSGKHFGWNGRFERALRATDQGKGGQGFTLSFLFLFLYIGKRHGKPPKQQGFFCPCQTLKIPGKEAKNAQENKEFLTRKKNKESKKNKGRTGSFRGYIFSQNWPMAMLRLL